MRRGLEVNFKFQTLYAPSISRRDSTRSIKGRMPNSLEMARAVLYFWELYI